MWESDALRAGSAGPGRSEDVMSRKSGKGTAKAVPRTHGRLKGTSGTRSRGSLYSAVQKHVSEMLS